MSRTMLTALALVGSLIAGLGLGACDQQDTKAIDDPPYLEERGRVLSGELVDRPGGPEADAFQADARRQLLQLRQRIKFYEAQAHLLDEAEQLEAREELNRLHARTLQLEQQLEDYETGPGQAGDFRASFQEASGEIRTEIERVGEQMVEASDKPG